MKYQLLNQFSSFILFLMVILVEACDIEVRLKSETEKPFRFHLSVESAKYWSDRVVVTGKSVKQADGSFTNYHVFHVKGDHCDEKNWHLFVWGLKEGSTLSEPVWKIADHIKFKMESLSLGLLQWQPHIYVTVNNDLKMHIGPQFGVAWCEYC
uniref:PUD1_2 domain-containing protein n=1 Tax=Elaeophora elaphi TaxID=1147741 RepID=A0A0R3RY30_9BILA